MNNICNYDEGYTKDDASEIGFCNKCKIKDCKFNNSLYYVLRKMEIGSSIKFESGESFYKVSHGTFAKNKNSIGNINMDKIFKKFENCFYKIV